VLDTFIRGSSQFTGPEFSVRSGCCAPVSAWKFHSSKFPVGLRLTRSFGSCSLLDLPPQAVSSCSAVRSPNLVSRVVAVSVFPAAWLRFLLALGAPTAGDISSAR
jgi:hypothetical protein